MRELSLAPQSLVDFAIRHLHVQASHGTLQNLTRGYELQPRTIQTYNFIFAIRGEPVWVIGGREYPLAPGTLCIVPPGVLHQGFSRTRKLTLVSLHLWARLPGGKDLFDLLIPPRVQSVGPHTPLDHYLRGMMSEYDRLPVSQVMMTLQGWAKLIVPELLRDNAGRCLLRHRSVDPLISGVLDELARMADQPVTLGQLAEIAGYSPQHLNRVFCEVLGVTPLKYLTRIRMERAAALVVEGRLTLRAISQKVGIEDPYYFSRLFKQHFGRSPTQFREASNPRNHRPRS